jgi:AraC-like DNA-binding protein
MALSPALPRVFAREFHDPYEFAATVFQGTAALSGRLSTRYRGSFQRLDLGSVKVNLASLPGQLAVSGLTPDRHLLMFSPGDPHERVISGRAVPSDALFQPRPNDLMYIRPVVGHRWQSGAIAFDYEAMHRAAVALAGRDVAPPRQDTAMFRPTSNDRARLVRLALDAAGLIGTNPGVLDTPAALALAGAIEDAAVMCLDQGDAEPDGAAARRHLRIMSRLETVLREDDSESLTLARICAAVGVRRQTLNQICLEFTGASVMKFVRDRRLVHVRRALLRANGGETTVGDVAMTHGFWELGRFAAYYRSLFGENPSETLRRDGD